MSEHDEHNPDKDRWTIFSTKTLFANPMVNLMTSRVRCGRTASEKDFYKFHFPRWVNIIALTDKRELVMIRQYRFGTGRVEWEIPGGTVEDGEEPLAAGLRELREETGYAGQNGRIIGKVCPNPAIQDNACYTVLVEGARRVAEPAQDDMEDIEVLLLPQDDVRQLVMTGAISHGLVLNALMFYAMHQGEQMGRQTSPRA